MRGARYRAGLRRVSSVGVDDGCQLLHRTSVDQMTRSDVGGYQQTRWAPNARARHRTRPLPLTSRLVSPALSPVRAADSLRRAPGSRPRVGAGPSAGLGRVVFVLVVRTGLQRLVPADARMIAQRLHRCARPVQLAPAWALCTVLSATDGGSVVLCRPRQSSSRFRGPAPAGAAAAVCARRCTHVYHATHIGVRGLCRSLVPCLGDLCLTLVRALHGNQRLSLCPCPLPLYARIVRQRGAQRVCRNGVRV